MTRELLRATGAGSSVALVVDFVAGTGELGIVVVQFVMSNIEAFLGIFAVSSSQIAPEVAWLPADALSKVVFALAVLYVLVAVGRLAASWRDRA